MSRRDAVVLASRTLALLLTAWIFSDLCSLPDRVFSYIHYVSYESTTPYTDYMRTYHLCVLTFSVTRTVGFLLLAILLYKAGPGVAAMLLPPEPSADPAQK